MSTFVGSARRSSVALMTRGRRAPQRGSQQRQRVPDPTAAGRAARETDGDAKKGERKAEPLDRAQPLVLQEKDGAERDEERRSKDEHGGARRGGPAQRFVKGDELGSEEKPRERAGCFRAVDAKDSPPGRCRIADDANAADRRTNTSLRDRP